MKCLEHMITRMGGTQVSFKAQLMKSMCLFAWKIWPNINKKHISISKAGDK